MSDPCIRCRNYCSPARRRPSRVVDIGELVGVIYRSAGNPYGRARTYVHIMQSRPRLACNLRGRQLYIIGGRYRVTNRGIEG